MQTIYKRPLAQEDLLEIWEYIADDSINRADAFIDIVDGKLRTLAAQPMMGRACDELMAGFVAFLSAVTYCFTNWLRMELSWCAYCMVPVTFPLNSKAGDTAGVFATSYFPRIEFPYRFISFSAFSQDVNRGLKRSACYPR